MRYDNHDRYFYSLLFSACCMSAIVLGVAWYGTESKDNRMETHLAGLNFTVHFPNPVEAEALVQSQTNENDSHMNMTYEDWLIGDHRNRDQEEMLLPERDVHPYTWSTYQSPNMKALMEAVSSGKEPSEALLLQAYLDLDLHGYQQYLALSNSDTEQLRDRLETQLGELVDQTQPYAGEDELAFVGRMIDTIHLAREISYQSDMNSVAAYVDQNMLQCRSISILLSILWMNHAEHFSDTEWVLVHQPQHVEFGLKIEDQVYAFNALNPNQIAQQYDESMRRESIAAYGKRELIDMIYAANNSVSPYSDRELYLWKTELTQSETNHTHPYAIPVHRIGISAERDDSEIVAHALQKPSAKKSDLDFGMDMIDYHIENMMESEAGQYQEPTFSWKPTFLRSRIFGTLLPLISQADRSILRDCYDREQRKDPSLKGSMTLDLDIEKDRIISARIVESSLNSQRVEECVIHKLKNRRITNNILVQKTQYTLRFAKE